VLVLGAVSISGYRSSASKQVLTDTLAEPLNGAQAATLTINPGDGNLTVDRLTGGEPLLAGGALEYLEKQGPPARTLTALGSQVEYTLQGGRAAQPWFRLPWAACNRATTWHVHLNPSVQYAIAALSNGGNVQLDLAGTRITRVAAETGGGNMDVVLPDQAADLNVSAKTGGGNVTVVVGSGITGRSSIEAGSGAGNVEVRVPSGVAVRIHASSGWGKVIVDPHFAKVDATTYESAGFDGAADAIDITVQSGAGNVTVSAS
jgi:hypothetical protein